MSWHKYKILAQSHKIEEIRKGEFPIPVFATLHLSYTCNQNCKSCAYAEWNEEKFMPSKEDCFKIIDELIGYGIKSFEFGGGGEPTCLPYFYDIIEYLILKNCTYGLITNGVNISDKLAEILKNTATYVRVSMETGDSELYAGYKGNDDHFKKVCENVKKILGGSAEISLKFDCDKNLQSKEHIKRSLFVADSLGVDMAMFKCMTGEFEHSYDEKVVLSDELNKYIESYIGKTRFINGIIHKEWNGQCWLTPLHTVVDGKGDVYLCCYYYRDDVHKKEDHCIGNILETPFKDLWGSELHKNKIDSINSKNCKKVDCKFFNHHRIVEDVLEHRKADIF